METQNGRICLLGVGCCIVLIKGCRIVTFKTLTHLYSHTSLYDDLLKDVLVISPQLFHLMYLSSNMKLICLPAFQFSS